MVSWYYFTMRIVPSFVNLTLTFLSLNSEPSRIGKLIDWRVARHLPSRLTYCDTCTFPIFLFPLTVTDATHDIYMI